MENEKPQREILSPIQQRLRLEERRRLSGEEQESASANREDFVLTPGGYRHRKLVHQLRQNEMIRQADGEIAHIDKETNEIINRYDTAAAEDSAGILPTPGSGWIATAGWTNATGAKIVEMRTTWVVPEAPAATENPLQTIFLFNGIQNSNNGVDGILQPVLQWGRSGTDDGGPFWAVASWYVTAANGRNGHSFKSQFQNVSPGQVVIGVIKLLGQGQIGWNYSCEFEGMPETQIGQDIPELIWANLTLEAYGIKKCADYPDQPNTRFTEIGVRTETGIPQINWAAYTPVTDCGQACIVIADGSADATIEIDYHH